MDDSIKDATRHAIRCVRFTRGVIRARAIWRLDEEVACTW